MCTHHSLQRLGFFATASHNVDAHTTCTHSGHSLAERQRTRHPEMQVAQAATRQPGTRDSCVSLCFLRISPFILTYNFPSQTCSSAQFRGINHVHRAVQPSPASSPEHSHPAKRRLGPRSTLAPIPSCVSSGPRPTVSLDLTALGLTSAGSTGRVLPAHSAQPVPSRVALLWPLTRFPFFFQVE